MIVKAGEKIATVKTDENGVAKIPFNVPVMDEGYGKKDEQGQLINEALNSGNYYFLEESVSDSYYIDREMHEVHLEYKNQETQTVKTNVTVKEDQTETVISKRMIASSVEIKDCHLKISDDKGNEIISWVSGDMSSVKMNENLKRMGYYNVHVEKDNDYALKINGLLKDKEYTLTETRPADGFVTADAITFKLVESGSNNCRTKVYVKSGDSFKENIDNQVVMYDDTTKIEFSKKDITNGRELSGCHMQVTEKDTGVVMDEWVSTEESHVIEGKYAVGNRLRTSIHRLPKSATMRSWPMFSASAWSVAARSSAPISSAGVQIPSCTGRQLTSRISCISFLRLLWGATPHNCIFGLRRMFFTDPSVRKV